jgi:SapC
MIAYRQPSPITPEILASRIFSPFAYRLIRHAAVVPITLDEAPRLCEWFAICWRGEAPHVQLVVVRGLLQDGLGMPQAALLSLHALPGLCLAYPFMFEPDREPSGGHAYWLDRELADQPTDAGAPISEPDGRPSKGTLLRTRSLEAIAANWPATREVTAMLTAHDAFEPWAPTAHVPAPASVIEDRLWVIKPAVFDNPKFRIALASHGADAMRMIVAHRFSLFRAASLIGLARTAAAALPAAAAVAVEATP